MTHEPLSVCIVEDETRLRALLVREIVAMGHHATGFRSAEEAWPTLCDSACHAVIIDLNLPGEYGMDLFRRVRERRSDLAMIILTGFGTLESAVLALRLGAADYLTKPCSLAQIEAVLARVQQTQRKALPTLHIGGMCNGALSSATTNDGPCERTLEQLEREQILSAMQTLRGNKPEVARMLGISLRTLYNKLKTYRVQGFVE
jgi:DNA-binding NtrC family response regulator